MCDAPAQTESAEPKKTKKGFHPWLACAASTRSYISMGNTHTHYDSTLINFSPSSQEVVKVVVFVNTQHAGPSEETETVEGVLGAGQATCH